MQSKWRAPACYVGVAMICALYLAVVPGVSITDICAGAGLGAAIMWAINEWETGKWNVAIPGQAVAPVALVTAPAIAPAPAAAAAAAPETPRPADATASSDAAAEPRARVDSGVATPETLAKWEIDEKEPSWDPSALAETWAKLRRELSISGPPRRPQVAPDLPRGAQFAQGNIAQGPGSRSASANAKPAASKSVAGSGLSSKSGPSSLSAKSSAPVKSAPPAKPALGALSKAYQESQRTASAPATPSKLGTGAADTASVSKASYSPGSSFAAPASSATPARKVAGGSAEPARSTGSFLRPGPLRPR